MTTVSMTTQAEPVQHFWVASGPFMESYFLFVPSLDSNSCSARLSFYDADGARVNDSEVKGIPGHPMVLEVGQFLGSCKLESGLRHAHLVVENEGKAWAGCRLTSGSSASMTGSFTQVTPERTGFMPVVFSAARHPLLCAVNYSQEELHIRCQLFFGARIPETELVIAPNGARLLALDLEFEQSLPKEAGKTVRAYLRFGVKGAGSGGVQVFELYPGPKGGEFVSAVG